MSGITGDAPVVVSAKYNDKTHSSGALVSQEGIVTANLNCDWTHQEGKTVEISVMQEGKEVICTLEYGMPQGITKSKEDLPMV